MSASKKFAFVVVIFALAFLSACGGGSGSTQNPPPAQTTGIVSGTVSGANTGTVACEGVSATIGTDGSYVCKNVPVGKATVTPSVSGFTITPASQSVTVPAGGTATANFTATKVVSTYTVTATADFNWMVPASQTVEAGQPASFPVTAVYNSTWGYVIGSTTGCTLTGTNCVTGPVNADGTVHIGGASVNDEFILNWYNVSPNVVSDNELASAQIPVTLSTYGKIDHLGVGFYPNSVDQALSPYYQETMLSRNGATGETIWSGTITTGITLPALRSLSGNADALQFYVRAYDSYGNQLPEQGVTPLFQIGIINHNVVTATSAPLQVTPGVYVTSNNAINLVLPYDPTANAFTNYQVAMKKVYQYYPDVFRVGVVHNFGQTRGVDQESGISSNNTVSGIGLPVSTGVTSPLTSLVIITPNDILEQYLLQYIGYGFGLFQLNDPKLPLADGGRSVSSPSTLVGQMGAFSTLVKQSDGGYLSVSNEIPNHCMNFTNWDNYILGVVPLSAVEPELFVLNPANRNISGEIPVAAVTQVSGANLPPVYGSRIPAYGAGARTDFPTAFVAVSGQPLTRAEWAMFELIVSHAASQEGTSPMNNQGSIPVCDTPAFGPATGGAGTMISTLPAAIK